MATSPRLWVVVRQDEKDVRFRGRQRAGQRKQKEGDQQGEERLHDGLDLAQQAEMTASVKHIPQPSCRCTALDRVCDAQCSAGVPVPL